jgi:uncharacterized damage-inducible protein DinB
MADASQLRKLVAYNEWANEKILTAIDGLTPEELARPVDAYFGTLAADLKHILFAMRVWLQRWKGEPTLTPDTTVSGTWREAYAATHEEFRRFVAALTDADADRVVSYRNLKGQSYQVPLAQLITHVVNHGTAHRAELGMLLERLGRSPGDMDYVYFHLVP